MDIWDCRSADHLVGRHHHHRARVSNPPTHRRAARGHSTLEADRPSGRVDSHRGDHRFSHLVSPGSTYSSDGGSRISSDSSVDGCGTEFAGDGHLSGGFHFVEPLLRQWPGPPQGLEPDGFADDRPVELRVDAHRGDSSSLHRGDLATENRADNGLAVVHRETGGADHRPIDRCAIMGGMGRRDAWSAEDESSPDEAWDEEPTEVSRPRRFADDDTDLEDDLDDDLDDELTTTHARRFDFSQFEDDETEVDPEPELDPEAESADEAEVGPEDEPVSADAAETAPDVVADPADESPVDPPEGSAVPEPVDLDSAEESVAVVAPPPSLNPQAQNAAAAAALTQRPTSRVLGFIEIAVGLIGLFAASFYVVNTLVLRVWDDKAPDSTSTLIVKIVVGLVVAVAGFLLTRHGSQVADTKAHSED